MGVRGEAKLVAGGRERKGRVPEGKRRRGGSLTNVLQKLPSLPTLAIPDLSAPPLPLSPFPRPPTNPLPPSSHLHLSLQVLHGAWVPVVPDVGQGFTRGVDQVTRHAAHNLCRSGQRAAGLLREVGQGLAEVLPGALHVVLWIGGGEVSWQ